MQQLAISDRLALPIETVTETIAILAKRGAGKTNTAVVLTEELVAAGQQVIVVDPVGVWYGLRSGADGKSGGIPVLIIGGDHADLPLTETSGEVIARILVGERQSAVLDLSQLSKSAARRLMTDFLETLYRVAREPLHLVVDEADLFAPQRLPRDMTRLLGAMDDVVRRGRAHGLGVTLISQRPAVLNKDVLGQAEVLIVLRMTNPRDVGAIDEWVRLHADEDQAQDVKKSLPSLPVGTAWVWSPGWLECLERVKVRPRRTFDSSATPRPGVAVRAPRLAAVDVQRLQRKLEHATTAAVDEPATSGGAAALRQQVVQLRSQVEQLQRRPAEIRIREVPVIDHSTRAELADAARQIRDLTEVLTTLAGNITTAMTNHPSNGAALGTESNPVAHKRSAPVIAPPPRTDQPADSIKLRAGALRMLRVMGDHYPARLSRAQLATLSHMKVSGGTFGTYLSTLRRNGLVTEQNDGAIAADPVLFRQPAG